MNQEIYYNTTDLKGETLDIFTEIAKTQNEKIKDLFKHSKKLSASKIVGIIGGNTPITSIRRALNSLEKQGFIFKTGDQISGLYGRPETVYKILEDQN